MKAHTGWLGVVVALALAVTGVFPAWATAEGELFSDFRIDAASLDFPQRSVAIDIYRPDETGALRVDDSIRHDCALNRVTGDASFYIQPKVDGVWVTVDYLTDLDGNGTYELLDSDTGTMRGIAPSAGSVLQLSAQAQPLEGGKSYVLSAQTLVEGCQVATQARIEADSACSLGLAVTDTSRQDLPLYLVNLHYQRPGSDEEQILSYYLKIYDKVLIPDDVSPSDWYYSAVEFVLTKGYLTGTGDGNFDPSGLANRAQLAQILWRMGGSLSAVGVQFSDVDEDDWYYSAVSWCCRQKLMSGLTEDTFGPTAALSREQTAQILYQYARHVDADVRARADLGAFTDADSISAWARGSVEWAVASGLLSGYEDGTLRPDNGLTRAQLSVMLQTYFQVLGLE